MNESNVYIKKANGRYEAIGVTNSDWLPDGIYYIRHTESGRATTSVPYLESVFRITDPKKISMRTVCGLEDMVDYIQSSPEYREMLSKGYYTAHDLIHLCVRKMYDKSQEYQSQEAE